MFKPKPRHKTIGGGTAFKSLGKQVVFEAGKQAGRIVEEGAKEILGGGGTTGSGKQQPKPTVPVRPPEEQEEIKRLQGEVKLVRQGPKRDVEKEIKEVREKKKEDEEEKFLQELEEKRKKEEEEAKRDAAAVLPPSSNRPKRGAAFAIGRKKRKTEARMGKN